MGDIYSEKLLAGQSLSGIGAGNVAAVLAEGNPDTAMKVFNRMFLALDYQRYPARDEFACRGFLQAMLMGQGFILRLKSSMHSGALTWKSMQERHTGCLSSNTFPGRKDFQRKRRNAFRWKPLSRSKICIMVSSLLLIKRNS